MSAETVTGLSYRDATINLLAIKLAATHLPSAEDDINWTAVAEAAVDELIDRPEREFKQQLAAVVASNEERDSMGSWAPATASGWL